LVAEGLLVKNLKKITLALICAHLAPYKKKWLREEDRFGVFLGARGSSKTSSGLKLLRLPDNPGSSRVKLEPIRRKRAAGSREGL
jgi:hypothetical protein